MARTKLNSNQLGEIQNEKLDSDLTAIGDLTTTGVLVRQSEGVIVATNNLALTSLTVGGTAVATTDSIATAVNSSQLIIDVSKRERGFDPDTRPLISWSKDETNLTISLTGTFTIFINGHRFQVESDSISMTLTSLLEGVHFIYYEENNDAPLLIHSMTPWSITYNKAPVVVFYWNATTNTLLGDLGYELHSCVLDWMTHFYLHHTRGTAFIDGFGLSGYTLNNSTASSLTLGITNGSIADEDVIIDIEHADVPSSYFQQKLTDPAQIPIYYKTGSQGYWRKSIANDYIGLVAGSGRLAYNEFTGGVWKQSEALSTYYCAYYIYATNMISEPIIAIQGQRQDSSLTNARNNTSINGMNLGNWFAVEFKLLYRIIYLTNNSYSNPLKSRIIEIEDYRGSSSTGNVAVPVQDHGQLAGLGDLDHSASSIYTDTLNFAGLFAGTTTTVQSALDIIDDHSHSFSSITSLPTTLSGYGITDALTSSNGTATNLQLNAVRYRQAADQSAGSGTVTMNFNDGDFFKITATGNIAIAISNIPSGYFVNMYLACHNFGAWSITWPSGTQWAGGVAPALTTSGKDLIGFSIDKNGVIMGALMGRDIR